MGAHSSLPTPTPTSTFLPVFTAAFGLFTAWRCVCVKNGLSYKNMKTRAGLGGAIKGGHPCECIPPEAMSSLLTPETAEAASLAAQAQAGVMLRGSAGHGAKGTCEI